MKRLVDEKKSLEKLSREEQARKDILATMRSLVERYGYHKITLDDIAKSLGKTKGFLYYYYPDKDAILEAAIEAESLAMQNEIDIAISKEVTGIAKIRAFILVCHLEIQKRQSLLSKLRGEVQSMEGRGVLGILLDKSGEFMKMDAPILKTLLEIGIKDGSLRSLKGGKLEAVAYMISTILHGIEYDYIMDKATEHNEKRIRLAIEALEHGIANPRNP